jgi:hypothetical protein
MTISPISAAGLSQDVLSASSLPLQQALLALQNSLASGDLNAAQSTFQRLQNILQNSATANGSTQSSNFQLAGDVTALGNALSAGTLSAAQSAFATVLGDLKTSASAAQINEATAASQSVQLVEGLLSSLNSSNTSGNTDSTTAILESFYGSQGGLNVYA